MHRPPDLDVTTLLEAWRGGDARALDRLMPVVYDELRTLARSYLRRERPDHTLQATAVTHEAYLRLVEKTHPRWQGRLHFFAVAAQVMRRVLVDHARARQAAKRGGDAVKVSLEAGAATVEPRLDVLDLDAALTRLTERDPRQARVIALRYFGGLTARETAQVLEVSEETVHLDSRFARSWLTRELAPGATGTPAAGAPAGS